MHRFGHSPFRRSDCQSPKPCQSDHEAKANRLLLPAKQGALRVPEQRREAELKRKPSPCREARGTAETETEPKTASMARALKGAQAGDPVGGSDGPLKFEGLVAASASSRRSGSWMEVRPSCQTTRRACAAGTEAGRGLLEASSLYRDWREGAAGSRKLKAASSRGSAGRSKAPHGTTPFPQNH